MIRIKICCIASAEEATLAVRHGASAVGLVSAMPSGPGVIADELIASIARTVPPGVARFLLTSRTEAPEIIEQQRRCGVDTLQLCDRVAPGTHEALRAALPGVRIVQVIHVTGPEAIEAARDASRLSDALLLDSGRPDLAVKELGGTGRTHDWEISRAICETVSIPVYLAGGLRADNVERAVRAVRPFAVDVCSGVRTGGALDEDKLRSFVDAVRAAGPASR